MRPIIGVDGRLTNSLTPGVAIELIDDVQFGYDDLLPDTTYVSPGFEYLTDEHGLPARVRGMLRLVPVPDRVRHPVVQRAVGKLSLDDALSYQGGHIVAVNVGGFASGPNLFPQVHNFNISSYARLEHGWRKAIREGDEVAVDVALTLDPDPYRPAFVIVTYWEGDDEFEHVMLNEHDAQ